MSDKIRCQDLAARRLRPGELSSYDLSSWRVAGVGAEVIRPEPLENFAIKLAGSGFTSRAFLSCYGMAECSLAVCFWHLRKGIQADHIDADQLAEHQKAVEVKPNLNTQNSKIATFVNCGALLPDYQMDKFSQRDNAAPSISADQV